MDELKEFSSQQLRAVVGFAVVRPGVGRITWEGRTDVEGVDLDAVVTIDADCCTVYEGVSNPPFRGEKLNKAAVVEMHVEPEDGEDMDEFVDMLKAYTKELDFATFIGYEATKHVWTMRMSQFVATPLTSPGSHGSSRSSNSQGDARAQIDVSEP